MSSYEEKEILGMLVARKVSFYLFIFKIVLFLGSLAYLYLHFEGIKIDSNFIRQEFNSFYIYVDIFFIAYYLVYILKLINQNQDR